MPIIKSAKKRARQAVVRHERNLQFKKRLKDAIKQLENSIAKKDKAKLSQQFNKVQSLLDHAVKKNLVVKGNAARRKAKYARQIKTITPKTKKAPAQATKKPAAKKTTKTTKTKKA